MGFLPKGVWIMDYCGFMGYGIRFSANQLGGPKKVWGIREYGLLELWVKRELTVSTIFCEQILIPYGFCAPTNTGFLVTLSRFTIT